MATMEVIKQHGIAGLTHRAVAREANVPLGSTTYHYANRQALIEAAMREAINEFEELISVWAVGLDAANVASRLVSLLMTQSAPGEARDRVLVEFDLYLSAARFVSLRPLSRDWDAVLRNLLEEKVGAGAGRVYFAVYQGFMFESLVSDEPLDPTEMLRILNAVVAD